MTQISSDLPAGNIRVLSQEGHKFLLQEEQRDSRNEWFYWKFKAVFEEPGTYEFRFNGWKVGTRSAAVSFDRGITWHWLAQTMHHDEKSFSFECREPGEVWFCQGIPYQQGEFDRFAAEFKNHPAFKVTELCRSRQGRSVELVTICDGQPEHTILLTSRHHCQEMSATHAMEGILRSALANDSFGCSFRKRFRILAVPFVDKDGAENGDQGKGRIPRDHGRDYYQKSLYPETAAIREIIEKEKPFFVLDMHCPWLRCQITNEETYLVEGTDPLRRCQLEMFGRILENEAPACAPYYYRNTNRYGVGWNTSANAGKDDSYGWGIGEFCAGKDYVKFGATIEIPFANFGERTINRYELLQYGHAIARSIARFADKVLVPQENKPVTLCFTGDVMLERGGLNACTLPDGSCDFRDLFLRVKNDLESDYTVGNMETTFSGEKAGYTNELYSFNSPDAFAYAVADAGFKLVSTANNHCLDRGVEGLKRTLTILDEAGLEHVGTARSGEERDKVVMREIGGIKVAFVCSTYGTNAFANHTFLKPEERFAVNLSQPQETLPGSVHLLDPMETITANVAALPQEETPELAHIRGDIERARAAGAEYIIMLMHSGGQYNPEPDAYTERLVGKLCSYGVDMIVGNHPHVIQKFAMKGNIPVFYCLGNLLGHPVGSPEGQKHPFHSNSVIVKPVLQRGADGKVQMISATFRVMRSVFLSEDKYCVVPLFEQIAAESDPAVRKGLEADMRQAVRIFKGLPEDSGVPLQLEYTLM